MPEKTTLTTAQIYERLNPVAAAIALLVEALQSERLTDFSESRIRRAILLLESKL